MSPQFDPELLRYRPQRRGRPMDEFGIGGGTPISPARLSPSSPPITGGGGTTGPSTMGGGGVQMTTTTTQPQGQNAPNMGNILANFGYTGAYNPSENPWQQAVIESTRAGALQNLEDVQKQMADAFSHRGGYFGGKHALSQAMLGERAINPLNRLLAEMNLRGYEQDIGQQERSWERAYRDWARARQERLMPFGGALPAAGMQTFENIVQQPQQSPWSALLQGIGTGIGNIPFIF